MKTRSIYRGYRFPPDIIAHAVWLYHRFALSLRDVEDLLAERGIDLPDGIDINVVENSDNTVHITMPKAPDGATELADDELRGAAAGCQGFFSWSCNSKC